MYAYTLIPLSSYLLITPLISNFASTVAYPSLNTVLTPISVYPFLLHVCPHLCLYLSLLFLQSPSSLQAFLTHPTHHLPMTHRSTLHIGHLLHAVLDYSQLCIKLQHMKWVTFNYFCPTKQQLHMVQSNICIFSPQIQILFAFLGSSIDPYTV